MFNEMVKNEWEEAITKLIPEVNPSCMHSALTLIDQSYNGRYYHNAQHIENVVYNIKKIISTSQIHVNTLPVLFVAAILHDVIYVPTNRANEEQSCVFAYNMLTLLNSTLLVVNRVNALIMSTSSKDIVAEHDKILHDADYSIMASSPMEYNEYANNLRREYTQYYSYRAYVIGRKQFLERQIMKQNIYYTQYAKDNHWETTAKANILIELKQLWREEDEINKARNDKDGK